MSHGPGEGDRPVEPFAQFFAWKSNSPCGNSNAEGAGCDTVVTGTHEADVRPHVAPPSTVVITTDATPEPVAVVPVNVRTAVKFAVMDFAASMVTVVAAALADATGPVQLPNVNPAFAAALTLTTVPVS